MNTKKVSISIGKDTYTRYFGKIYLSKIINTVLEDLTYNEVMGLKNPQYLEYLKEKCKRNGL